MALFGSFDTVRAQAAPTPEFIVAFAYVEELLRLGSAARARLNGIEPGSSQKVELGGGVFAIEQVYGTKHRSEGIFESHKKYIDVQVLIEGEERMEVMDARGMTVRQVYDAERDYMLYLDSGAVDSGAGAQLRLSAGQAAIFFPVDAHMPSLRAGAESLVVRKTVVKVPVA